MKITVLGLEIIYNGSIFCYYVSNKLLYIYYILTNDLQQCIGNTIGIIYRIHREKNQLVPLQLCTQQYEH